MRLVGAELSPADGRTDGHNKAKTLFFFSFANAPKEQCLTENEINAQMMK
jgi:hypothetical protein